MSGLGDLRAQIAHDLEVLGLDPGAWAPARDGVSDVVVVGGGQSGLGAAFGLLREKIASVLVIDENQAGEEGPWVTYARMITLRTPKELLSIEGGVPSLSFRLWWEAQHGAAGWRALDKIPRGAWMDYLKWFRDILAIPVENGTRLLRVTPRGDGVHALQVRGAAGERVILARKVILATGIQGGGEWHTPAMIAQALPKSRYAHTSEPIDYAALAGKRIAILGGGASAFDNANWAMEAGVGEAHVFVRRERLPHVNPIRFMERTGFVPRFASLDDADKYRVIASFLERNQPPTNDTFQRAAARRGFRLHLGAPWKAVRETVDGVEVETPHGRHVFDFLVLSTGLLTDCALRPELAEVADKIATWRDRRPAMGDGRPHPLIDDHPYLGRGFEFTPKTPADAALLRGLFAFNYSALASFGLSASAISGLRHAIPRLAAAVADQLFQDQKGDWMNAYLAYEEPEFVSTWSPEAAE
jgi:cation diffusion facilitator CzcD-associated flavoprotein CzcO